MKVEGVFTRGLVQPGPPSHPQNLRLRAGLTNSAILASSSCSWRAFSLMFSMVWVQRVASSAMFASASLTKSLNSLSNGKKV